MPAFLARENEDHSEQVQLVQTEHQMDEKLLLFGPIGYAVCSHSCLNFHLPSLCLFFYEKMLTSCTNSYCHDLMQGTCSSFLFSFEMETYNSFYQEILTALSTCFLLLWEHRQCCCASDPDIVCGLNIIDNYFILSFFRKKINMLPFAFILNCAYVLLFWI